jgi:hypothetical protein
MGRIVFYLIVALVSAAFPQVASARIAKAIHATLEQFGAVGDGVTDDSAAIQACWDASQANGYICYGGKATYLIKNSLVIKDRTQFRGHSQGYTVLKCDPTLNRCVTLAVGPVTSVSMGHFTLRGDITNPAQQGFYLEAVANAGGTGGLWNAVFDEIEADRFTAETLWLRGGLTGFLRPMQFITIRHLDIENLAAFAPAVGSYRVKMSGQIDQIMFEGGAINGPGTGDNIYLGHEGTPTNNAPTNVTFLNFTCQTADRCLFAERGGSITYEDGWIEGILGKAFTTVNTRQMNIQRNHLGASCHASDLTGYCLSADSSIATGSFKDNDIIGGTPDKVVIMTNGAVFDVSGNYGFVGDFTSVGLTTQKNPAATLSTGMFKDILLNSGATPVTTISSFLGPGQTITMRVNTGTGATFDVGGNISFGGITTPLVILAGQTITFERMDLGATWVVIATSVPH